MIQRVNAWMDRYGWVPWAIALAGLLYGGVAPFAPLYDAIVPVVSMQGEIVARDKDSVTVRMWGKKNRDCRFVGIQGFSKQEEAGLSRDATGQRMDMPSVGATKPTGSFEIGVWRFRPVVNAKIVEVYAQHDCGGRTVVTQIAKVVL